MRTIGPAGFREEDLWNCGRRTDDGRTTDGRTPEHGYTISSPMSLRLRWAKKLGYAGVYLFFLFLLQNIDYGYSLEPPRRGSSSMYPQSMFWAKTSILFCWKFHLCILYEHVFVMRTKAENGCTSHSLWKQNARTRLVYCLTNYQQRCLLDCQNVVFIYLKILVNPSTDIQAVT